MYKIKIKVLKNGLYNKNMKVYNAKQVSIVLRMEHILFTDLKKVWKYDSKNCCFYEFDLQKGIQDLFEGAPISHSFEKAVMDFLPFLEAKKIQDYGKYRGLGEDDIINTPLESKYIEYLENEEDVNKKIEYNVLFNENLREQFEVIDFKQNTNE